MGFEALDGLPRATLIFGALTVVFAALALRDRMRFGPAMTPSRRAWLRVAVIFAIVTIVTALQRA